MKHRSIVVVFCLVLVAQTVFGQLRTVVTNPYRAITNRNVFGLHAPPLPKTGQTPAEVPQIILTGLSTITGRKLALLKLEFPAKPAQRQREDSCILKEGEADGPVRVLQIDMKAQTVKVDNSGTIAVLTFEKNGPKPQPAAPARRWPIMTAAMPTRR